MVLQSIDHSVRIKLHDPNAFNVKQNAAKVDNKGTNAALPYGIEHNFFGHVSIFVVIGVSAMILGIFPVRLLIVLRCSVRVCRSCYFIEPLEDFLCVCNGKGP